MMTFKEYCYTSVLVWIMMMICILLSKTDFTMQLMTAFTIQALVHLIFIYNLNKHNENSKQ